jgi:hypothetical protein
VTQTFELTPVALTLGEPVTFDSQHGVCRKQLLHSPASINMPAMTWLAWLGLAVIITAFAAVTGFKARGTRPVAHTRLMGMARLALWVIVIIVAYLAFRAYSGS